MKKIIAFLIFIIATSFGSVFSQNLIGSWQIQNPDEKQISQKVIISNNTLEIQATDLETKESGASTYSCEITSNQIAVKDSSGGVNEMTIIWVNPDKFTVPIEGGERIFARCGSKYDKFLSKYKTRQTLKILAGVAVVAIGTAAVISATNDNNNYNSNNYVAPETKTAAPATRSTICKVCLGTGNCPACKGLKTTSLFGYTSKCNGCTDGKCTHCHGTGKQ